MSTLQEIEDRAEVNQHNRDASQTETDDALSLVAALRAVEKIHVPVRQTNHRGGRDMCRHDTYDWPCPTIRAIQEALA